MPAKYYYPKSLFDGIEIFTYKELDELLVWKKDLRIIFRGAGWFGSIWVDIWYEFWEYYAVFYSIDIINKKTKRVYISLFTKKATTKEEIKEKIKKEMRYYGFKEKEDEIEVLNLLFNDNSENFDELNKKEINDNIWIKNENKKKYSFTPEEIEKLNQIEPDVLSNYGEHALLKLIQPGEIKIDFEYVSALINAGIDVLHKNSDGLDFLMKAIKYRKYDLVNYLLDNHLDKINIHTTRYIDSKLLKKLVSNWVKFYSFSPEGFEPLLRSGENVLHLLCKQNNSASLKLIKRFINLWVNVDVYEKDRNYTIVLLFYETFIEHNSNISSEEKEIFELLIDKTSTSNLNRPCLTGNGDPNIYLLDSIVYRLPESKDQEYFKKIINKLIDRGIILQHPRYIKEIKKKEDFDYFKELLPKILPKD